jgi:response regulator of citrate/malate metabolism
MAEKAKTREQLAAEFGISRKTFRRWLKRKNIEVSKGLINLAEQKNIYNTFGRPTKTEEKQKPKKW